ncbi:MAG: hypothetical protein DWG76_04385 [Chloroflexi bacterium]|nr:hypothetical protein [Chloroflexota bacterium]
MSFDLRRYAGQTNRRLLLGFFVILFLVGDGLIWWRYGWPAALTGVVCLLGGIALLALIAGLFWIMDILVKRYRD